MAAGGNYGNDDNDVTTACLADSCFILELVDSFGDGWNGAEITISFPALGLMYGPFTLDAGYHAALSVGLGDCSDNDWTGGGGNGGGNGGGSVDTYGCLDPAASNFDPTATSDDGSCDYVSCLVFGCSDELACNYDPGAQFNEMRLHIQLHTLQRSLKMEVLYSRLLIYVKDLILRVLNWDRITVLRKIIPTYTIMNFDF